MFGRPFEKFGLIWRFSLAGADCVGPGMTQAVLIDEVLPKCMFICDQVVTRWVAAEGRPDAFTAVVVYVRP